MAGLVANGCVVILLVICTSSICHCAVGDVNMQAKCEIKDDSGIPTQAINGMITFQQKMMGGDVTVSINLEGFDSANMGTKHGFHVHMTGSLGNQCSDAGGHYNPMNKNHGAPSDTERHVGDLGNVVQGENGVVITDITDSVISLMGMHTIIGRAVVVHAGEDDLGLGGESDSLTTGHAGKRLGCCVIEATNAYELEAECVVDSESGDASEAISGTVKLEQKNYGGATEINIDLEGFDTADGDTLHGFHIHSNGDLGNGCVAAGGHYNPFGKDHSSRTSEDRHVGDLGNIEEDGEGKVEVEFEDGMVMLSGEYSVVGKAIVIHEGEDDLGLGGQSDSLTTGHAGGRLACCIITVKQAGSLTDGSTAVYSSLILVLMAAILAALLH